MLLMTIIPIILVLGPVIIYQAVQFYAGEKNHGVSLHMDIYYDALHTACLFCDRDRVYMGYLCKRRHGGASGGAYQPGSISVGRAVYLLYEYNYVYASWFFAAVYMEKL